MSNPAPDKFEQKLERLDAIVKEIESGKIELDRALELFKEGRTIARDCETILRSAQEQVDRVINEAPQA